jgi:hypothetical protein
MADTRKCEQCGTAFTPRREHVRFCSADCRVAWVRAHRGDPAAQVSALGWSVTAMSEAAGRLSSVQTWHEVRAFGAVSEAVWWVTIVDATMVRFHPDVYDEVLDGFTPDKRRLVEETLEGLRFVRNQVGGGGQADFVRPAGGNGEPGGIAGWTWAPLPEPPLSSLLPRGQAWEMSRYQAYQARLAGQTVGATFSLVAAFLQLAAEKAACLTDSAPATSLSGPGLGSPLPRGQVGGGAQPHTSAAVSTTSRSLARCSSAVSLFPSTVEEKPHCGDRHS